MRGMLVRAIVAITVVVTFQGCDALKPQSDIFILDWTGGPSVLWDDGDLVATDLSEFVVRSGGTLDDVECFQDMVRAQVEVIFHAAGIDATIVTGERQRNANVVHISPVAVDKDGDQVVGRGYYDPCNRSHRDSCIVYAQSIIDDNLTCTVPQWVNIFANISAHEIGHNLGFDHVEVADLPPWTGYVELMLASDTWYNRRLEQRILVEQDTCPDITDAKVATPISMPLTRRTE